MTDPLEINIPLEGVDASFPLLPEQDYELKVISSEVNPNYDKSGHQWDLVYGLTETATAIDGREVKPNFRLYPDWPLQLQPRADGKGGTEWTGSMAEKSLCATVDAIFGSDKSNRPAFNRDLIQQAVGQTVIGRVAIDTDKNGVQRNKVVRLKPAGGS